jgi:ATP-dependent protease HslVU (ClpYQ) peptidase subunit
MTTIVAVKNKNGQVFFGHDGLMTAGNELVHRNFTKFTKFKYFGILSAGPVHPIHLMRYKYHALFDNLIITDETDLIKFRDIYFDNVLQDGSITQQKKDEIESDVDMVIVTKHKIFHITGQ